MYITHVGDFSYLRDQLYKIDNEHGFSRRPLARDSFHNLVDFLGRVERDHWNRLEASERGQSHAIVIVAVLRSVVLDFKDNVQRLYSTRIVWFSRSFRSACCVRI